MSDRLFNYVDAAFFINLDARTDKRDLIVAHFDALGIGKFVQRKRALEPPDLGLGYTIQETGKYVHAAYSKGCLYTHIAIIREAKANGWKNVLIFEDDAHFYTGGGYDPIECIQDAIDSLRKIENWELFYLGTNPGDKFTEFDMVAPHLVRTKEAIGTHAVLINSTIFDKILSEYTHHYAFDIYLTITYQQKYLAYPMCVLQRHGILNDIAITPYHGLDKHFWLRMYNKKINKLYTP